MGKHRYVHELCALDIVLPGLKRPAKGQLGEVRAGAFQEGAGWFSATKNMIGEKSPCLKGG